MKNPRKPPERVCRRRKAPIVGGGEDAAAIVLASWQNYRIFRQVSPEFSKSYQPFNPQLFSMLQCYFLARLTGPRNSFITGARSKETKPAPRPKPERHVKATPLHVEKLEAKSEGVWLAGRRKSLRGAITGPVTQVEAGRGSRPPEAGGSETCPGCQRFAAGCTRSPQGRFVRSRRQGSGFGRNARTASEHLAPSPFYGVLQWISLQTKRGPPPGSCRYCEPRRQECDRVYLHLCRFPTRGPRTVQLDLALDLRNSPRPMANSPSLPEVWAFVRRPDRNQGARWLALQQCRADVAAGWSMDTPPGARTGMIMG